MMAKCVCGNPEFEDQNVNADSDCGLNNIAPPTTESIQPTNTEIVSNHEPSSNEINISNVNPEGHEHSNPDIPTPIEDSFNVEQHTNTGVLCDVLKTENFSKSEGQSLNDKLQPDDGPNKFGKIHKSLNCLMGNGRDQVLTIPEIVDELLPRNYPGFIDFDGTEKLVTFIPEWYLTKASKFVDPSRGPQLQEYSKQMANEQLCPERRKVFEDMKKFHLGGQRTQRGELPERELYDALQAYFHSKK